MKKYLVLLILLVSLVSCEDFLDPKISQDVTYDQLLTQPDKISGLVHFAYRGIPNTNDIYGNDFLESATDNAVSNNLSGSVSRMIEIDGYWGATRNPLNNWGNRYEEIMSINKFFAITDDNDVVYIKSSERNDSIVQRVIRGEAYFLRAHAHLDLLKRFGGLDTEGKMMGVPVVKEDINPVEFSDLARKSYLETVEAIADDLDSAILYLPAEWAVVPEKDIDYNYLGYDQNVGRPTQMICNALKSRMYLYAASPAFSEGLSDEIVDSLYLASATASKAVLDVIGFDYSFKEWIYWEESYDGGLETHNISGTFFNNILNPEVIMRRVTGGGSASQERGLETRHLIPSLYGGGRCNPSQNLVDAFPMRNGYPIDDAANRGNYDPTKPYEDRDPRFYQTVMYNGYTFHGVNVETFNGGADYAGGNVLANVGNTSRTGYYLRKWLSDKVVLAAGQEVSDYHYGTLLRKVEMHLNFAEAVFMANNKDANAMFEGKSAKDAMKSIVDRAAYNPSYPYLNEVAADPTLFEEYLKNERRIELCFEGGHRFFDLRRWKDDLSTPVQGVEIESDSVTYRVVDVIASPAFDNTNYYTPLPQSEINIMPNLTQNKGW